jgi:hypothetical protein
MSVSLIGAPQMALEYIQRGWQVTPVRPREKRPIHDDWPMLNITAADVPRYFSPNHNVGVILGDVSQGLVDIDLDCPETIALADHFLPATGEFGRASKRRSHRLYYARGARTEKFLQPLGAGKTQTLVELRANKFGAKEGLQTVFPRSIHESGEAVEWETDKRELTTITPEPLRRAVAQLAAAALLVRVGWPEARAVAAVKLGTAHALIDALAEEYALVARWLGLPARAHQPARPAGAPANNRVKRASAYLAKIEGAVSGAGGHQKAWGAALAVVRGFDLAEGEGYTLLASEYNPRCDPPWSERELRHKIADASNNARVERGYLLRQERPITARTNGVAHVAQEPSPQPTTSDWDPPVEFGAFELPPFPAEALPSQLGDFVRACALATQTPMDLPGMLVLSATAACCAKRVVLEVKPGYREPLNLFTLAALPSGHRKSAVLREVAAPLIEWEAKAAEDKAPEIAKASQRWAISKKRLDSITDRAAKAKTKGEREQLELEVEDLTEQHAKLTLPPEPRILADDVTPEALGSLLAKYGGRMAILSAEGGVFQQMAGRYSDSPNLDVYLKAHAGDEIRVDRQSRGAERVTDPALTLGISPQPHVLEALAEKPLLRGTGLLARFLYALPTSMLGARTDDAPPIPDAVRSAYVGALRRLLVLQAQKEPFALKLSPEAYQAWREFYLWVEPQLAEGGELESISDWGSKLPGAVARIAGILGILRILCLKANSEDLSISIYIDREEMVRAIALGKYLVPHARAAFSSMGADPKLQGAKQLLKTVLRKGWSSFSRRELQQSVRRSERFNDADQLDAALRVLVERGFIRPQAPSMSAGPGRPAGPTFEVNPHIPENILNIHKNQASAHLREREPGEDDE